MSRKASILFFLVILSIKRKTSEELRSPLNVVLFLARTSNGESYDEDKGIRLMNFVEKSRIKHCALVNRDDSLGQYMSSESECSQLLKASLYSLIGYCRGVLGMTTAIAALENDTFSNALRFKKSASEDLEIRYHYPHKKLEPHYITDPQHTEIFKIRSKRQQHISGFPSPQAAKPPNKDFLGVLGTLKLTFFRKLFDDRQKSKAFEAKMDLSQLGKASENSLFNLVKETLSSLCKDKSGGSFLLIVVGGSLKDIADSYSGLMQSVKHVVENTDERNTLIVVSGSCPIQKEPTSDQCKIPVYVKGPPSTASLMIDTQLFNLPYAIKTLLTDINIGNMRHKRQVRLKRTEEVSKGKSTAGASTLSIMLLLAKTIL